MRVMGKNAQLDKRCMCWESITMKRYGDILEQEDLGANSEDVLLFSYLKTHPLLLSKKRSIRIPTRSHPLRVPITRLEPPLLLPKQASIPLKRLFRLLQHRLKLTGFTLLVLLFLFGSHGGFGLHFCLEGGPVLGVVIIHCGHDGWDVWWSCRMRSRDGDNGRREDCWIVVRRLGQGRVFVDGLAMKQWALCGKMGTMSWDSGHCFIVAHCYDLYAVDHKQDIVSLPSMAF